MFKKIVKRKTISDNKNYLSNACLCTFYLTFIENISNVLNRSIKYKIYSKSFVICISLFFLKTSVELL